MIKEQFKMVLTLKIMLVIVSTKCREKNDSNYTESSEALCRNRKNLQGSEQLQMIFIFRIRNEME